MFQGVEMMLLPNKQFKTKEGVCVTLRKAVKAHI